GRTAGRPPRWWCGPRPPPRAARRPRRRRRPARPRRPPAAAYAVRRRTGEGGAWRDPTVLTEFPNSVRSESSHCEDWGATTSEDAMIELSDAARTTAGIALAAATTGAAGGRLLSTIVVGRLAATDFQKAFFRAGHAHAGVFIVLGLLCLLLTEATSLTGAWQWLARSGVLVAAIVMPMGFFFSAIGTGRTSP